MGNEKGLISQYSKSEIESNTFEKLVQSQQNIEKTQFKMAIFTIKTEKDREWIQQKPANVVKIEMKLFLIKKTKVMTLSLDRGQTYENGESHGM